ncbi:MAG TPA: Hsp20/alpha crystallin family protein [Phycisphaerae bacterium]|nr:Hsp20/alpha crystallin family protein [Phycisphaerae bacterium]
MTAETTMEKKTHEVTRAEPVRQGFTYVPPVDIVELPEELVLMADVPGACPQDIDIKYEKGLLTLQAKVAPRQQGKTEFLVREYGVGDYFRSFEVGEGIDADNIEASVQQGVLTLRLPKSAAAKPRKIAVRGA